MIQPPRVLLMLLLGLAAQPVCATVDIVSNLGQTSTDGATLDAPGIGQAQSFQTGAGSLALASVLLRMEDFNGGANSVASVEVRADNAGVPGGLVEALGNVNVVADFATFYTVPAAGTNVLVPNTKYWVVVRYVSGDFDWSLTTSASWSGLGTLLDDDSFTSNGGASWAADVPGERFVLAVRGVDASPVHYVALGNPTPAFPYNTWSTAATNIQDAIDVASSGETVLVSNGVYRTGGRIAVTGSETNRVVIDKPLAVRSVNGAAVTFIEGKSPSGNDAVRCVWMTNGAELVGFTLRQGATGNSLVSDLSGRGLGGGVVGSLGTPLAVVRNAIVTGNQALFGAGAANVHLVNCLLDYNEASSVAGGAYACRLDFCTVVDNIASDDAGGVAASEVHNSIVYLNVGFFGANHVQDSSFFDSCTFPMPTNGARNIDIDPLFTDHADGDRTLLPGSPCRDTANPYADPGLSDVEGLPRVVGLLPDRGAFEVQSGPSPDFDADGLSNGEETLAGSDPFDGQDVWMIFALLSDTNANVQFPMEAGRIYAVDRSSDLDNPSGWTEIGSNLSGPSGLFTFPDPSAPGTEAYYRVRVRINEALTGCGNGVVDAGEGCDDGNNVSGDGCSAICQIED